MERLSMVLGTADGVGVREFLWLAIALLAVYVAVQLYRVL